MHEPSSNHASNAAPSRPRRRFPTAILIVPLALVVGVLGLFFARGSRRPDAAPAVRWVALEGDLVGGDGGALQADDAFWSGLEAYENRDAAGAIREFSHSKAGGGFENLRRLFLASSYSAAGRHDEALTTIRSLDRATLPDSWTDEATWIECVSLNGTGRANEARPKLEALVREAGPLGEAARAALH